MRPAGQATCASPLDESQVFHWSQVSGGHKTHIPLREDSRIRDSLYQRHLQVLKILQGCGDTHIQAMLRTRKGEDCFKHQAASVLRWTVFHLKSKPEFKVIYEYTLKMEKKKQQEGQ